MGWRFNGPVALRLAMLISAIAALLGAPCFGEETTVSVEEVKRAWADRRTKVTSFQYEFDSIEDRIETIVDGRVQAPSARNARDRKTCEVQLSTALVVKMDGKRIAYAIHGDGGRMSCKAIPGCSWSGGCDGAINWDMHTSPTRGVPTHGTFLRRGVPQTPLTASGTLKPIWMWYDPLTFLDATGHDVNRMTLSGTTLKREGRDQLRLNVPRKKGTWNAELLLANSPPFSPTRLTLLREKVPMMTLQLHHTVYPLGGDSLASWKETQLGDNGLLWFTHAAVASSFTANKKFEDSEFEGKFPIGTHLREFSDVHTEKAYWIQSTETEMKQITSSEYLSDIK